MDVLAHNLLANELFDNNVEKLYPGVIKQLLLKTILRPYYLLSSPAQLRTHTTGNHSRDIAMVRTIIRPNH